MSVDYILHIAHAYHVSEKRLRRQKTVEALTTRGTAIVGGALTTAGSTAFLFPCWNYLFYQLGVMLFLNTIVSLTFTFFFLCPLLMAAGPTGEFCSVYSFLGRIQRRDVEERWRGASARVRSISARDALAQVRSISARDALARRLRMRGGGPPSACAEGEDEESPRGGSPRTRADSEESPRGGLPRARADSEESPRSGLPRAHADSEESPGEAPGASAGPAELETTPWHRSKEVLESPARPLVEEPSEVEDPLEGASVDADDGFDADDGLDADDGFDVPLERADDDDAVSLMSGATGMSTASAYRI